jgi:hypothetical protein
MLGKIAKQLIGFIPNYIQIYDLENINELQKMFLKNFTNNYFNKLEMRATEALHLNLTTPKNYYNAINNVNIFRDFMIKSIDQPIKPEHNIVGIIKVTKDGVETCQVYNDVSLIREILEDKYFRTSYGEITLKRC